MPKLRLNRLSKAKQEIFDINNEITALQKKVSYFGETKKYLKLHIRMLDEEIMEEPEEEAGSKYIQDKNIEKLKMRMYPEKG